MLHDQDHIFTGVNDLVKSNDLLVPHLFHKFDLSLHRLSPIRVHELVLFVNFHGNLLVSRLM